MRDLITVSFMVNGRRVQAQAPAGMTLLDFLRRELGLTGTKKGCETGHCGACTVLINAVRDAAGVRITQLPATPSRLRAALQHRSSGR
ncbi:MAG: (2Fe-2S)-binding protein [Anaerolineae bacterium]